MLASALVGVLIIIVGLLTLIVAVNHRSGLARAYRSLTEENHRRNETLQRVKTEALKAADVDPVAAVILDEIRNLEQWTQSREIT